MAEPTTVLPPFIDMDAVLPELTTPQERYDHGFKRGYMAGYAEGARQLEQERSAEVAAQKTAWAGLVSRATSTVNQLASATDQYVASFGARDIEVCERLLKAAFQLAEAVVGAELRARPERAVEVARAFLTEMPAGPATVKVNPADEALISEAAAKLNSHYGVSVVADPSVGPGGCIVTSGARTADARIEAALARAREVFCAPPEDREDAGKPAAAFRVAGARQVEPRA